MEKEGFFFARAIDCTLVHLSTMNSYVLYTYIARWVFFYEGIPFPYEQFCNVKNTPR